MATSISYFSRRGTTPGKSKGRKSAQAQAQNQAQAYQVTPLFFQETIEANQSIGSYRMTTGNGEDGEASFSFE